MSVAVHNEVGLSEGDDGGVLWLNIPILIKLLFCYLFNNKCLYLIVFPYFFITKHIVRRTICPCFNVCCGAECEAYEPRVIVKDHSAVQDCLLHPPPLVWI